MNPEAVPSLVDKFPREMFITSYHHFRRVMCSTKYTIEQKDTAFGDLAIDYLRCKVTGRDTITFVSITEEWIIRGGWE